MISDATLPLFEANMFLANREWGFSWGDTISRLIESDRHNPANPRLEGFGAILVELERRLAASVTADASEVAILFRQLSPDDASSKLHSCGYLYNVIVDNMTDASMLSDNDAFVQHVRSRKGDISATIARLITGAECNDRNIPMERLFRIVNGSALPAESKLLLIDLAVDPDRYIAMLERTLLPVANEFRRCQKLIAPLMEEYRSRYCAEGVTAEEVLRRVWNDGGRSFESYSVHPFVIGGNTCAIDSDMPRSARLTGYVGVLFEFFYENYLSNDTEDIELQFVFGALNNRNRLGILERLMHGSAYGKELAAALELSPVTISQHIGVLVGAGLITARTDGVRAYYSLNERGVERFLDRVNNFFSRSRS